MKRSVHVLACIGELLKSWMDACGLDLSLQHIAATVIASLQAHCQLLNALCKLLFLCHSKGVLHLMLYLKAGWSREHFLRFVAQSSPLKIPRGKVEFAANMCFAYPENTVCGKGRS